MSLNRHWFSVPLTFILSLFTVIPIAIIYSYGQKLSTTKYTNGDGLASGMYGYDILFVTSVCFFVSLIPHKFHFLQNKFERLSWFLGQFLVYLFWVWEIFAVTYN